MALQRAWTVWEPAFHLQPYPPGFTGRFFNQRVLKLPPWAPRPCDVVAAKMWSAGSLQNAQGLWQVLIDRGGEYTKSAHFPATQTCAFGAPTFRCTQNVHVLADFELSTGSSIGPGYAFIPPVRIYSEDRLIMCAEGLGGQWATPLWSLSWIDAPGPVPPDAPTTTEAAFSATLPTPNPTPTNEVSLRTILPLTAGGDRIRVQFQAGNLPLTMRFASIGIHAGTFADTVEEPVELPFGNKSGFQIAAHTGIMSDWVELETTSGQTAVVIMDVEGGSGDMIDTLGYGTCWYEQASTYAEEAPRALTLFGVPCGFDANTHAVTLIEVGS